MSRFYSLILGLVALSGLLTGAPANAQSGSGQLVATKAYDPPVLPHGVSIGTTLAVPGARPGYPAVVSYDRVGSSNVQLSAHVEDRDLVRVVIRNESGSPLNLPPGTLTVIVFAPDAPQRAARPAESAPAQGRVVTGDPAQGADPIPTPPPPQSGGTTYFVSPAGKDSNAGTQEEPFQTIQRAANIVNPGDTVIVEDGTYVMPVGSTPCSPETTVVCVARGGTANNWVVFKSRRRWGAKIDGRNNAVHNGWTFQNKVGYVRIEGFDISGMGNRAGSASGVDLYNGGHNVQVVGNRIHHIGRLCTDSSNGMVGVFVQRRKVLIEGNVIHDIGRFAPGEQGCNPTTINYQHHDHGVYLSVQHSSDPNLAADGATVRNNIFYNNRRGWSVQVFNGVGVNINILNNTFSGGNPHRQNAHVVIYNVSLSNSKVANNIFHQESGAAITIGNLRQMTNVVIAHNLTNATAMTDRRPPDGMSVGDNQIATDPQLANPAAFNFRLRPGSPAIDAGERMSEVTTDFEGRSRPQGAGHDIGAHESGGGKTQSSR